jgi:alanyl-tRNA synthetase
VEERANRVIWENRPVEVHFVAPEDIGSVPLRKPPQVSGPVRVIWVPGYDASACGGTHVARSGEVGLLKITNLARYKGGVRVTFLCGERARRDYQRALSGLQSASAGLSVHQDELGEAIARLQEENKETRRALKAAQNELVEFRAEKLWRAAPESGGLRRVVAHWDDRSFEEARLLAARLSERRRTLALLAISEAKGLRLVCTRSQDLPEIDAGAVLRAAAGPLGGRGGGSPEMAQGGGQNRPHETVMAALKAAVEEKK